MLKHLQEVIGLDMGDIPIYHSDTEALFGYAQIKNQWRLYFINDEEKRL